MFGTRLLQLTYSCHPPSSSDILEVYSEDDKQIFQNPTVSADEKFRSDLQEISLRRLKVSQTRTFSQIRVGRHSAVRPLSALIQMEKVKNRYRGHNLGKATNIISRPTTPVPVISPVCTIGSARTQNRPHTLRWGLKDERVDCKPRLQGRRRKKNRG